MKKTDIIILRVSKEQKQELKKKAKRKKLTLSKYLIIMGLGES
jgi:hypothetical protein